MNEKPFMLMLVSALIFLTGLIAVCYGVFQCIVFPDGNFVLRWFSGDSNGFIALIPVGIVCLILGSTFVISLCKTLIIQKTFAMCSTLTTSVKVVSKSSKIIYSSGTPRSPRKVALYTLYFISFEFSDKGIKDFQVDDKTYNAILENDMGTLTFKEHNADTLFISFLRQY